MPSAAGPSVVPTTHIDRVNQLELNLDDYTRGNVRGKSTSNVVATANSSKGFVSTLKTKNSNN